MKRSIVKVILKDFELNATWIINPSNKTITKKVIKKEVERLLEEDLLSPSEIINKILFENGISQIHPNGGIQL